jgi:superfamily II DNA/RNA helicase
MQYPASSFGDLHFLIPAGTDANHPPPSFVVFCSTTEECEEAALALRKLLPPELQDKIIWYYSCTSSQFREEQLTNLCSGKIWGAVCTDAFGMVSHHSQVHASKTAHP